MRPVIIVQARMTSTRLAGKVLREVLHRPLLEYLVERLRRVKRAEHIVIATTTNDTDIPIVELCERLSVPFFRGSEHDVLARYHMTAEAHHADPVIRITSDCPVIDPAVIDHIIEFYVNNPDTYDYVSNALVRSYPRGMDTEVFSFQALHEAFTEATAQPDREHVTPFIYTRPKRYRLGHVVYGENLSRHRWTVDTPEDFDLIRKIIESLYPAKHEFGMQDILDLMTAHPDWPVINAHIEQKKLDYGSTKKDNHD